jgi:hypothetical protein
MIGGIYVMNAHDMGRIAAAGDFAAPERRLVPLADTMHSDHSTPGKTKRSRTTSNEQH